MGRIRFWVVTICVLFAVVIFYSTRPVGPHHSRGPHHGLFSPDIPWPKQKPQIWEVKPTCRGARGGSIDDVKTEDLPHPVHHLRSSKDLEAGERPYPIPTYGSYEALGLEKTWMTFAQRYGPYGYGEHEPNYNFTVVQWSSVNWAQLQDDCLLIQPHRSRGDDFLQVGASPRFRLASDIRTPQPAHAKTGRQAVILRTWETYHYSHEDMWNIRSLITEANLASQGTYTVFLFVDVKRDDGARVHRDPNYYRQVLEQSVPKEFWDIAVLFHESLLVSWYPKVAEHSSFYQIMQPLQLFAHFYPEFDHFWQFEMDTRFIGHAGKILGAYHKFGRNQPYKQSRERASWTFMPKIHESYEALSAGINKALGGNATIWGPIDTGIAGFVPAGPKPPVSDPTEDNFEWLAGEDADLLLYTFAFDITRIQTPQDWPFTGWISGFDMKLPRLGAFPAQARASRTLLEAIHVNQRDLGLKVHSEATLPSFALWHGLKIVQIPLPKFSFPERDAEELNSLYNGGKPTAFKDGIANGAAPYRSGAVKWYARPRTFEWSSSLIEPLWKHWMNEKDMQPSSLNKAEKRAISTNGRIPDELPPFLAEVDGQVYAPNFMLHPRKTNQNPSP